MKGPLALLVVATVASGCLFGGCGPQVGSVEADFLVDARFTPENKTAMREALKQVGFTVSDDSYFPLHATRSGETLWANEELDTNTTTVHLSLLARSREFPDTEGGHRRAERYLADEEARLHPRAHEVHVLLVQAVGLPPPETPPLTGYISIC